MYGKLGEDGHKQEHPFLHMLKKRVGRKIVAVIEAANLLSQHVIWAPRDLFWRLMHNRTNCVVSFHISSSVHLDSFQARQPPEEDFQVPFSRQKSRSSVHLSIKWQSRLTEMAQKRVKDLEPENSIRTTDRTGRLGEMDTGRRRNSED